MKKSESIESVATKPIRVLLAEDNTNFRKSLKLLIEVDGNIRVVGEAKNGSEAVSLAKSLKPEVIVMDIAMPLLNGLQATEKIKSASPDIRVVILSAHPDPEYVIQAMNFGASGYLIKQSSTEFLGLAVREILKGRTYFSLSLPKQLRDECQGIFDKDAALKKKAA